jgi:hypothetical protein
MNKICEKYTVSIIKAAYKDASFAERIRVRFHLRRCEECRNLFREHNVVAKALHQVPELECPDILIKKALSEVNDGKTYQPSFLYDLFSILARFSFRKMAVGFAVIVIIVVFALLNRDYIKSDGSREYSEAQIEKANIQARQALAIISSVLNTTQTKLKNEILPEKVAKPINKSLYVINDLFNSGDKNESH